MVNPRDIAGERKKKKKRRNRYQRKTLFFVAVSINWPTNRNWHTEVRDTWKVTQLNLFRPSNMYNDSQGPIGFVDIVSIMFYPAEAEVTVVDVCWLLNVPATCECISGADLLRQFYVLPH